MPSAVREIQLRGHIIDSGLLGRVLALIMDDAHAKYTIDELVVGHRVDDPSLARLRLEADSESRLDDLLYRLRELGVELVVEENAQTELAPADGVLPDAFYATTNLETEVRVVGEWVAVANPEMDCAIVLDANGARTVPGYDVRKDDAVVVSSVGVRVHALQRARHREVFAFMSSAVSSEKPKESLIAE